MRGPACHFKPGIRELPSALPYGIVGSCGCFLCLKSTALRLEPRVCIIDLVLPVLSRLDGDVGGPTSCPKHPLAQLAFVPHPVGWLRCLLPRVSSALLLVDPAMLLFAVFCNPLLAGAGVPARFRATYEPIVVLDKARNGLCVWLRQSEISRFPRQGAELACCVGDDGPACNGHSRVVFSQVCDDVLWRDGNRALHTYDDAKRRLMIEDF